MNAIRLGPAHLERYRALMLEGYASHPDAFTSSVAERAALPLDWWQARLKDEPSPSVVALGVELDSELAGAVGVAFESREKIRHKSTLVGLYVREHFRKLGVGAALVAAVLATARERPGVLLVQLTVSDHNVGAKRLYRRHGFVEFGVEPMAMTAGAGYVAKCHMWCNLSATASVA